MLSLLGDYQFKTFTNPSEYSEALGYACDKDETKHFPKEIPPNAKNVLLHKPNDCWFGSDYFSLSFQTDKQYIDNELKKHKFIETEGPYQTDEEYSNNSMRYYALKHLNLNKSNFKFYIIGNNTTDKSSFPLEYGIAINNKTNTILYYYECID